MQSIHRLKPIQSFSGGAVVALALCFYLAPFEGFSILWVAIWALSTLALQKLFPLNVSAALRKVALGLGIIFALCTVIGHEISLHMSLEQCFDSPYAVASLLIQLLGIAIIYDGLLLLAFRHCLKRDWHAQGREWLCFTANLRSFFLCWLIIFVCWLPYFILCYPGTLAPDSVNELNQIIPMMFVNNHHPFIHQMLIRKLVLLGNTLGSMNLGAALYSLCQMLAMSGILSASLWYMARLKTNRGVRLGSFLYFALLPTNALFSFAMIKDVLFAGFTVLVMILLFEEARDRSTNDEPRWLSLFRAVLLCGMLAIFSIFRNNGFYVFLLIFPFFILINRVHWKRLLAIGVSVIVLVTGYQSLIYNVLGVAKGSFGEAMSVPLQQIARTVKDHGDELAPEDYAALRPYLPNAEALGEKYNPRLSDPVKMGDVFLVDHFSKEPIGFVKAWGELGLRYPASYVTAFLCQSLGYWYPDERDPQNEIVFFNIEENSYEITQNTAFADARAWLEASYNRLAAAPLVSILFSIGAMVWLTLFCAVLLIMKKRGRLASPLLLLLGLWLTTLASPAYCEYRYILGLILSTPLCFAIALSASHKHKAVLC